MIAVLRAPGSDDPAIPPIRLVDWIKAAGVTPSTVITCRLGGHSTTTEAHPYGFWLAESATRGRTCEVSWPAPIAGAPGHWWAIVRDRCVLAGSWAPGDEARLEQALAKARGLVGQ